MESLAVKYRPSEFTDVCSQHSVIAILQRQIELNQISHAILFSGPSGCGKTTLARIYANKVNKGQGHPMEIDAASNNGIENVRDLLKSASERSLDSEYKIIIMDECHALSGNAWQALLKGIEEPSPYTIFIFCTTDPQKIPATILNRVMRFNLTRIDTDTIRNRLEYICQQEHFTNYKDSCDYISRIADGGMRTAISLLEKVASYNTDISLDNTLEALGDISYDVMFDLADFITNDIEDRLLRLINYVYDTGADLKSFLDKFITLCLDISKYLIFKDIKMTKIPSNFENELIEISKIENIQSKYNYYLDKLMECKNSILYDNNFKTTIEINLLNIARLK